ncbi:MAG TPA: M56 family metallopeptidase [Pyrinomonadaceae bacterium]|jgi:Zn-dependent protease with chaperone function|nr:M56 family metallopeptidase [Pyrinomonadaceae bacterium]
MYELLGLSLLLAALLTFNSLASLLMAGLWRVAGRATKSWTAVSRARLLFSLRTLPALLAFLSVAMLFLPSYLAYEPRHTAETVSFKLGLLAFLSATGIAVSVYRGIATHRATANLTSNWLNQGKPIQIAGIDIKVYRIEHTFPLIAIIGFLRPRLFIASQVLEILTPEEISAAVAHENGHLAARDNLKRGLLQACRDALLIIPSGRLLDAAWSEASEEAADENAAREGNGVALDLASALVKIARIIPLGARPAMPAGVFLLGDDEKKGVKSRVRRLIALAATERRPGSRHPALAKLFVWVPFSMLLVSLVVAAANPHLLSRVHYLIEHAVFALR